MSTNAGIRYLKRSEIDTEKWNSCINDATNGLVYGYAWYLDALCDNWDALVLDDYTAVMPLPWRKKWGMRYVYTPAFIQQLGIVGNADAALQTAFQKQLHCFSRYGDYHLNFRNQFSAATPRTNIILPLQQPYEVLRQGYSKHLQRNLTRASKNRLSYRISKDYKQAIELFSNLFKGNLPGTKSKDFENVYRFCSQHPDHWCIRQVNDLKGDTLASALMLHAKERFYLLMPAVTAEGRSLSAGHFLIDQFIQEQAGSGGAVLDFEGSDLPGVQRLYASFGGSNQPYFFYHWNNLPAPLRWIKK